MDSLSPITNMDVLGLITKRVKEYRLAARISQSELAEKSGIEYTAISHFELGKYIFRNFISLLRCIGMEGRVLELLPELPVLPIALMEINELILRCVRRKKR